MPQHLKDPSNLLSPYSSLKCSEAIRPLNFDSHEYDSDYDEEEIGQIEFICSFPLHPVVQHNSATSSHITLRFRCRDQSVNFLQSGEPTECQPDEKTECQEAIDPHFFDTGYTLAGSTGFQIWAGSRIMMETLLHYPSTLSESRNLVNCMKRNSIIEMYQNRIKDGANILELGSGVGVVGTSLAAVGGHVLMTDLPTLVDYSLCPNIFVNTAKGNLSTENNDGCQSPPTWLGSDVSAIHNGWASATALDWTRPVQDQLTTRQTDEVQIIVSCDCVWLVSMLDGLLDSVEAIFNASTHDDISFLMSFQRRDSKESNNSSMFTTVEKVLSAVDLKGWNLTCLAWRPIVVKCENDSKEEREVFVFEIKP